MKTGTGSSFGLIKYYTLLILAILGVGAIAQAGLEFEPGVGYQLTSPFSYKFSFLQATYNETSIPLDLKVDIVSMSGMMIGVEGTYFLSGSLTPNNAATQGTVTDTFTRTVAGVIVGYFHPMKGFRIWAGYDFVDSVTNTQPSGTAFAADFKSLSGTGYHVGLGYAFSPHVVLSVTYGVPTYTSITPVNSLFGTTFSSTAYNSFNDSQTYVSLSFPFGGGK